MISSVLRVVSMVAPLIITLVIFLLFQRYWRRIDQFCVTGRIYGTPHITTLVICLLSQKYWRRINQLCVTGRVYGSFTDHYFSNIFIISEILEEDLSVLCHE